MLLNGPLERGGGGVRPRTNGGGTEIDLLVNVDLIGGGARNGRDTNGKGGGRAEKGRGYLLPLEERRGRRGRRQVREKTLPLRDRLRRERRWNIGIWRGQSGRGRTVPLVYGRQGNR